ncbi:hypothetical protein PUNSTDRAFT_107422 [Punctularia strigosozonata HHB-11173 SS5]|uniref:Beta-glucuronidase C-terminal domain-containing protein n=1 Tax=Punctularia strigosozonata (strain HHB-11173) TaxID=741275 RepID=R7S5V7_PUNST|nr:uncharacterized protein PUNSTDRAFT_107422 [Punctularia strigosozonata HHB-11173 SS5]EIN05136.1 hypothetical protein PUNSTDRAFT_107422 [Punctularia strigosozonata HHB-11173 SS5]
MRHPFALLPGALLSVLLIGLSFNNLDGPVLLASAVTVYSQQPIATTTASGATASYTGAAAYDPTVLNPPPIPDPLPSMSFGIQLQSSSDAVSGLSIKQNGGFMGFSIEFSVINQVLGKNSSYLQIPFLNLMSNIRQRAGHVRIRVGGNTQETATLVDSLADGKILEKDEDNLTNPTDTPPLVFTPDVLYMLNNISALVNTKWYLGVPFNDTTNLRLSIVQVGEAVLGDNLLGLQVGNEPDLYVKHNHRSGTYSPYDYFGEFGVLVQALAAAPDLYPVRNNLIAPSIATGDWTPEMVWDTGFIPSYTDSLGALAVEHYPDDNCFAIYGIGSPRDPQTEFPNYLNHTSGQSIVQPYLNSTAIAQAAGKSFIMLETNTASCGGFPGISDSFGAALWALDYGLQMAYSNFSGAMLHVGGQNVYYNPFTPPPTNQSTFHQWTIGPVYYSALVIAEVFGSSNESQIVDLFPNDARIYTPAYAIYENGSPARVALFNYITDSSGNSDYTASISINGGTVPSSVKVKYLSAPSVSSKNDNITWAGQTFGATFASDGRLKGDLDLQTVTCDTTANTCPIKVPAPGFALVFLSDDALSAADSVSTMTATFSTTSVTKTANTVTIDASVLATSNGHSGKDRKLGSTSKGSSSDAPGSAAMSAFAAVAAMTFGAIVLVGRWWM